MTTTDLETATETELLLRVDGARPPSAETAAAMNTLCDRAEDAASPAAVVLLLSGTPELPWPAATGVQVVNKWERAVRRLERLEAVTVAIAEGDCGGLALDVLLATDFRLATADVRLVMADHDGAGWPGMALYRLVQQVGAARARRPALFGGTIPGSEGLDLHLIDEIVGDVPNGIGRAHQVAASRRGTELAIRRRLLEEASTATFEDALGRHLAACDRLLRRRTQKEGTL
ncbi:enoyl-CoA hydratase/isomerase family protein (plasmid) [Streptomyces cellulosae]|uniref:enoyl-CoA-hydratase DpgB n=1 Tax=Streptomyces cellulosae TaxID=1968 RepID=UPI002F919D2E|nr:enoyl-CoA hydratase/isomerase family protein [Streptomyces cellulosae]WTB85971.1 enoyl-CoA hydratase/isomerase family protein [Streptomyces cellulosae]WTB86407.1 enoyl-CoA hydratase/isomerase family protein [Streptomyces cellulosae]WTB86699.1 enoyl-CoA hydratase/isomerase family protein [Streptomyces cellulosae]WTB86799.1 enoyl-CoA hydratase/isomerase family protein [Streptomyces cellulosae]